jgi:spore coat protein A
MDAHPIHLHLVSSQLVNRQKFNAEVNEENGKPTNIRLIGQPKSPDPDEVGWKDTWVMYPGEVTRIIAKFDLEGLYVWHCHILSHEDHEMMRPYYVGQMEQPTTINATHKMADLAFEKQVQLAVMPNPFTQTFTIRFNLPQSSDVMLNMYDTKGSLIKKVQNKTLSKGQQTLTIDGSELVNGIYFLRSYNQPPKHLTQNDFKEITIGKALKDNLYMAGNIPISYIFPCIVEHE